MSDDDKKAADDNGSDPDGGAKDKVTFTPEQQNKLQELIDASYAKAYSKASSQFQNKITELESKIQPAKKDDGDKKDAQGDKKDGKFTSDEVQAKIDAINKAHLDQLNNLTSDMEKFRTDTLKSKIVAAAAECDCVKPGQLADLILSNNHVKIVNGEIELDPPDGITKIGDDGKEISLAVFVERFIAANTHFKNFRGQPGTGSHTGDPGDKTGLLKNMTREQILNMPAEEFDKMRKEQFGNGGTGWLV